MQVAWSTAWEATQIFSPGGPPPYGNIQNAACRPATFLNFIYNNFFQSISQSYTNAGMCAQGLSAGSAQIAYSMAYYGAANFLDNVELISGPPLSDIEQGCEEPPPTNPTAICPAGQYGCNLGTGPSWSLYPTYVSSTGHNVGSWTNDHSCVSPKGTSGTSNSEWLIQSIIDQPSISGGPTPSFTYPSTGMSAWLCRTLMNQSLCDANHPNDCPNNSSPQGQIFYNNFTSTNHPPVYNVYAVDQCEGPEGVQQGNVTGILGDPEGFVAIENNMVQHCAHPVH